MNEIDMLHDVFGPDEVPSATAHDRARSALADRINIRAPSRRSRWSRWGLRATAAVAAAAAVAAGVVVARTP